MKSNDFGNITLEQCRKIKISDVLKQYRDRLKEMLLSSSVEINGLFVATVTSKTGFGGVRHWFQCPACMRRVGVLLVHPVTSAVGCRVCLGLEYRKRRFKGMPENI